jgi:dTDP-4-amino-4,6-dideoxygalactose transaminase
MWRAYGEKLAGLPLDLPSEPAHQTRHAYHLMTVLLRLDQLRATRSTIASALAAEGIGTGLHYAPVHVQPFYRRIFGYRPDDLPHAWRAGERTLSLPLSPTMASADVEDVCCAMRRVLAYYSR